jgi:hypothetical protein
LKSNKILANTQQNKKTISSLYILIPGNNFVIKNTQIL